MLIVVYAEYKVITLIESLQSGYTKGKTQGAPGLSPVKVLQGKLVEPSKVFMLMKVISSDLERVMFLKYSFAFFT